MIRSFILALVFLVISMGQAARAEYANVSLRDLVKSDHIVYARVERIHVVGRQWRLDKKGHRIRIPKNTVAEARVVRVFQGKEISVGQTILIAAYKTWACDDTRISLGEEAMFFLEKRDVTREENYGLPYPGWEKDILKFLGNKPLYGLVYSGQGKLAISINQGSIAVSAYRSNYSDACFGRSPYRIQPALPVSWDAQVKKTPGGTIYREGHISVEAMERFLTQLIVEENAKKMARVKQGRGL